MRLPPPRDETASAPIDPAIGRVPLLKLQPVHVSRLYAAMMARGLSAKTTRNTGLVLHRAIEQARRWGLLPLNVCSLVDLPRWRGRRRKH